MRLLQGAAVGRDSELRRVLLQGVVAVATLSVHILAGELPERSSCCENIVGRSAHHVERIHENMGSERRRVKQIRHASANIGSVVYAGFGKRTAGALCCENYVVRASLHWNSVLSSLADTALVLSGVYAGMFLNTRFCGGFQGTPKQFLGVCFWSTWTLTLPIKRDIAVLGQEPILMGRLRVQVPVWWFERKPKGKSQFVGAPFKQQTPKSYTWHSCQPQNGRVAQKLAKASARISHRFTRSKACRFSQKRKLRSLFESCMSM